MRILVYTTEKKKKKVWGEAELLLKLHMDIWNRLVRLEVHSHRLTV